MMHVIHRLYVFELKGYIKFSSLGTYYCVYSCCSLVCLYNLRLMYVYFKVVIVIEEYKTRKTNHKFLYLISPFQNRLLWLV